ncbi:MAG TPA: hypothetical protein GXX24_09730 [Paracoccus solventivorans]|uniref:Ferrochelatase n=1 Tax=Paracoccus solventivorans TaxID=53463 RepID=A0A832PNR6_9RHOB|nr:hypothetical protein [Paracoccus solventivorans]
MLITTKVTAFAAALTLSASTALAGGYVAPVVEVEPVVVDSQPASTNAGVVIPALLLLGVIAAIALSDSNGGGGGGAEPEPDPEPVL